MQPDSPVPQEEIIPLAEPASVPQVKKPRRFNIQLIFLVILLLVVAGVGYWAMQKNTALMAATKDLNDLQTKYDALTSEKNSLAGELDQTMKDIESSRQEIAASKEAITTAKSDLSKTNVDTRSLEGKMESAGRYIGIIRTMYEDDVDGLSSLVAFILILDLEDDELMTLFSEWLGDPDFYTWAEWTGYALETAIDILSK